MRSINFILSCGLAIMLKTLINNRIVHAGILPESENEIDFNSSTIVPTENGIIRGLATNDRMVERTVKKVLGLGKKTIEEENKLPRKFIGIPFAAPPIGENRFKKPQPLKSWGGIDQSGKPFGPVYDATKVTKACVQLMPVLLQDEDCLHLDIYTPPMNKIRELGGRLSVMVWIFPGGFFFSNKNMFDMYDGAYLAQTKNTIIVSINHRLGPFGFISADGADKNVGLFDQRAALEWISRNIARFGGNPNDITILGESSGAYSVLAHMVSPTTPPNLFHKAIVMSSPTSINLRKDESLAASTLTLAKKANCVDATNKTDIKCLRERSWATILKGHGNMLVTEETNVSVLSDQFKWWASLDNDFFVEEVYDSFIKGSFLKVPLLIGLAKDDAGFFADFYGNRVTGKFTGLSSDFTTQGFADRLDRAFQDKLANVTEYYPLPTNDTETVARFSDLITDMLFRCPIKTISDAIIKHNSTVYTYELAQDPPRPYKLTGFCRNHTCHTSDLLYLWSRGATLFDRVTLNSKQRQLAGQLQTYWTNFAASGDPNRQTTSDNKHYNSTETDSLPIWPPSKLGEHKHQELNDKVQFVTNSRERYCDLWDTIGYNF